MGKTTLLRTIAATHGARLYGGVFEVSPASGDGDLVIESEDPEIIKIGPDLAWVRSQILTSYGSALVAVDDCDSPDLRCVRDWVADLLAQRPDYVCVVAGRTSLDDHWPKVELGGVPDIAASDLLHIPLGEGAETINRTVGGSPARLTAIGEAISNRGLRPEAIELDLKTNRDPAGAAQDQASVLALRRIDNELLQYLSAYPLGLHQMEPRAFEEVMAELFVRHGFEVELTQPTRDGGADLLVVKRAPHGRILTLVDAKRYRPDNPVSVEEVREMYGTLSLRDASAGVIATTSYFTPDAREIAAKHEFRLGLQEFSDILAMLRAAVR
jgi:Restriction endonuclease